MRKNRFLFIILALLILFSGCGREAVLPDAAAEIDGLTFKERVELTYADQFAIDRYEGGYSMISVVSGEKYLVVPENVEVPEGLDKNVKILRRPAENIYLVASSAMSFFDALGQVGAVQYSGTVTEDWYIDSAREAMERGDILYAGSYREPDYELLLTGGCELSVQSTMIDHSPEVKEKLEELGITVFVDYSSYETHPLGRSEWIKVYGELLGEEEKAEQLMEAETRRLKELETFDGQKKSVVFFYITSSGQIYTQKSGNYVSNMIELAGGENLFSDLGDDKATTAIAVEPELFYARAKDADILIYNTTIGGAPATMEEFVAKNAILADFKAVQEGNVWCAKKNLYQETMKLGAVIADFNTVIAGKDDQELQFLYKPESGEKID